MIVPVVPDWSYCSSTKRQDSALQKPSGLPAGTLEQANLGLMK